MSEKQPKPEKQRRISDNCDNCDKNYELTARHEELLHKFGATMLAMPDALLYEEITGEHGRPHPEKWID